MLLTPREVAARLRVSLRTVYLWLEEGRLPAVRLSERVTRVPSEAVDAFVREATVPPQARTQLLAAEPAAPHAPSARRIMMDTLSLVRSKRAEIERIARRRHASNVRVFGSVARGEVGPGSDIDLLVDLEPDASLFDLGGLGVELTDLLGMPVDVTPAGSLRPLIRDRVLREAIPL